MNDPRAWFALLLVLAVLWLGMGYCASKKADKQRKADMEYFKKLEALGPRRNP